MAGLRIAFLGLPLAALLLARDGHEIVLAGICRRGAPGTRRLRALLGDARVDVKPALSQAYLRRVRAAKPDLVVSWFWTTKIPPELVALAPMGGFGVHPSLLPRWRGPDPYFWAIDAGDRETGVTAHRLDAEYDTGALLASRALVIEPIRASDSRISTSRPLRAMARATARPTMPAPMTTQSADSIFGQPPVH